MKLVKHLGVGPVPGVLITPTEKFDFERAKELCVDPVELSHELARVMLSENGVGIAANQVGSPHRVFLIKSDPIIVCFNPRIVDSSEAKTTEVEGCLSFPELRVEVERPAEIRIRYEQPNGETVTKHWVGRTARIAQHELDHLDGVLFYSRAKKFHLDRARRRQRIALKRWRA